MKLILLIKIGMVCALSGGVVTAIVSPKVMSKLLTVTTAPPLTAAAMNRYTLIPGSIRTGDTFMVSDGQQEIEIKLCGIAAPEVSQGLGEAAREHLGSLFSQSDGPMILADISVDEEGRTIAEAFLPIADSEEEIHLNSQMVMDGMAQVHPAEVSACQNAGPMRIAEQLAREKKRGLWSESED